MRRPQQPQIADHQGPRRLGVPNEGIIERQAQTRRLPLGVQDVDDQHPRLAPRGRKPMPSLGRLAPAMGAAEAYPPTVEADAHPLASQGPVAWHGHVEGRLERRITQADAG